MGLVYWISCNETNENYIGSTTTTLKQRMFSHKCNKQSSSSIIDRNNYKVIILEDNIDRDILRIREQFYMDCCDNLINKNKAYNKQIIKTIKKPIIKPIIKSENIKRCECGCMISEINKSQHISTMKHITIMKKIYSLKCINRYFNPYGL